MYYWNNWYTGWGWFLWFGIFFLFFSTLGNWGYTYQAHRKFSDANSKDAMDILNERYARGDLKQDEYLQIKTQISNEVEERRRRNQLQHNASSLRTSRA